MSFSFIFLWLMVDIEFCVSSTYYVDPSASSGGSGISWSQAFKTLDTALSSATSTSDEIWLMRDNTYIPSSPSDRFDCFRPNNGISIYGGFDGTETNINQRNPNNLASIISGDIGVLNENTDNCYHVIEYTYSLRLDNVIIQDGYANYNDANYETQTNVLHRYGGGIISSRTNFMALSLYLNNVIIRNNTAINGGGLFVRGNNADIIIKDSKFEYNQAIDGQFEGGYGGAIYAMHLSNVTLFNTEFNYNQALYRGGAIYQDYGAYLHGDGCTFNNNKVNGWGGAVFSEDRNSQTDGTFPKIIASTFEYNYAGIDGGAICWYNGVIGILRNNIFRYNTAGGKGGAIALINAQSTSNQNTFVSNTANGNSSTDNEYDEAEFTYSELDNTLTFDITAELSQLYTVWNTMLTEADLYPFNAANSLCYVDIDKPETGQNGNSWATAYKYIQQCLDQQSNNGGEIWVKQGTYIPTTVPDWKVRIGKTNNFHKSFSMYDNIKMYGGFVGTETSRNERNWRDNPTYLSCQITSYIQCNQILNAADNTLIDGFIFTNAGNGVGRRRRLANSISVAQILSSTSTTPGSGIFSNSTTISVVNSIFHKLLTSGKGGAVYCIGLQGETGITKSPTFINVAFLGNRAAMRGGAISADVQCNFVCKSCKFESNSCSKKGGAIYLDFNCDPIFVDSTFTNNYALESGGCIAGDGGSFSHFDGTTTFTSNYAKMEGGCLYSGSGVGPGTIQGYGFNEAPTFTSNHMLYTGTGQNDIYGWPYSTVNMSLSTTTAIPTTSPTPGPTSSVQHSQPNIIIFFIDDLKITESWSQSAPKGMDLEGKTVSYSEYSTPNINQFRNEAVVFTKSYCAAPKCAPSRFALLTGRQTVRSQYAIEATLETSSGELGTNVTIQTSKLSGNDSFDNIPYILSHDINTPYYTGMVGKWHLMTTGDDPYQCRGIDSNPNDELYQNCIGIVKQQGFDFVDAFYYANLPDYPSYFSHNPEWMVSQSQKFINQAINVENKPFFLYFSTTITHGPLMVYTLSNFSRRDSPKGTLTGNDFPDDTSMSTRNEILAAATTECGGIPIKKESIASYMWIDDTFGALINYLKINNLYDNTFIALMNDHGMAAKGLLYDQGSRIINFVRYPPLFGDNGPYIMPDDFVVSNVDLGAVIFELTGITPPDTYKTDGISWINDVQNEINNPNTAQQTCCKYRYIDVFNSHSIVNEQYQYIYRANPNLVENDNAVYDLYPNTFDEEQIYDLISDPNQKINQIGNAQLSTTINTFQTLIRDYIQDICPINTGCKMPDLLFTSSPTTTSNTPSPTTNAPTTTSPTTKAPTTRSPTINTASGQTCMDIINWQTRFRRITSWNEATMGPTYIATAEELFIDEYPECGTYNSQTMDYYYCFSYIPNRLTIFFHFCCGDGETFGTNYVIPENNPHKACYLENAAFISNLDKSSFTEPTKYGPKQYIVFGIVGAIVLCLCAVFIYCYKKMKKRKTNLSKSIEMAIAKVPETKDIVLSHGRDSTDGSSDASNRYQGHLIHIKHNTDSSDQESQDTFNTNLSPPIQLMGRVIVPSQSVDDDEEIPKFSALPQQSNSVDSVHHCHDNQ